MRHVHLHERSGFLIILMLIICSFIIPRHFLAKGHDLFILHAFPEVKDTFSIFPHVKPLPTPIELNRADSATLVSVRGIGPYYASKIIKYRQRLGGYYSVLQLKEVKMTYFNADSSQHLFTVDPSLILKRDLNTLSFKEVLRHPYLEYEDVCLIFNAKNKNKSISIQILEENNILPSHKLEKIKPYFK